MKKIIFLSLIPILFSYCTRYPNPVDRTLTDSYLNGPGVFILNEGNFRSGNGSLSFFSYDSAKIFNNVFLSTNQRHLGDIPYYMSFSGINAYIVVNNSNKIEVVKEDNMSSVSTITGLVSPRYMAVTGAGKAYVTSLYSDSLAVVDLSGNSVAGHIDLKHTSESIVTLYSTAYVACWTAGNKIFVINTATDQVTDSIEVGMEPESMVVDKNETLWVLCNGGWQRNYYAELIAINTLTNTVSKRFPFGSIADSPTCLRIDGSGEILYFLLDGVRKMNISDTGLPLQSFIPAGDHNFYKLGINPSNGEIFVTDVVDYLQRGYLLRYDRYGILLGSYQAEINPGFLCFRVSSGGITE